MGTQAPDPSGGCLLDGVRWENDGAADAVHADDAPADFALEVVPSADETIIAVSGELDACTAPRLRELLCDIGDSNRVVVDASGMTFIDSSALGVLVGAARRLRSNGGQLVVRRPRPPAYRVFELTCTVQVLGVES